MMTPPAPPRQARGVFEPVWLFDMDDARDRQSALGVHGFHTAQAGAGHRAAVIGVLAADDDGLVRLALCRPVMAHHPHDCVVGLRTAAGEEDAIEVGRGYLGE